MFYLLSVIIVLISILYLASSRLSEKKRPPGPKGLPIIGNLLQINAEAPHETLTELAREYGPVYSLKMGSVNTVVISDHKLIKKLFAKEAFSGRAPLYVTHGIMKGYGLICAEGDLWKDQRKFVSSCLRNFGAAKGTPKRERIQELIQKGVKEFLQLVDHQSKNEENVHVLKPLRHCLGNIMNSIVFGQTWGLDDPTWSWLQNLQEEGTKHIGVAGPLNFLPFLRFLPSFRKTMSFLIEGKEETHKIYKKLIDSHEERLASKTNDPNGNVLGQNIIEAFLLERKKRCSSTSEFYCDQQFFHLLADIFGAGLDTTLATLRWFFLFMVAFPNEQAKVQEELDQVLEGKSPTLEDMANLPYLEAAICEAQRIRSVVPVGIPHGTLEDTEFEGYTIPKGTMVIPLQWAIHMNPKLWYNPNLFYPSRFLDSEGRFSKPEFFLPFQAGKRMCIGDELARMLLFFFTASTLQKYNIHCPLGEKIDLEGECGITLTPKGQKFIFSHRKLFINLKK